MADKPVKEVLAVDAALDALVSPTSSDVYEAVDPFSDQAVAAAAARRALSPGGSVALDDLTDVNTAGGSTGDVLTQKLDGSFDLETPSGGSQPAIGRPKQADNSTFTGVPGASAANVWTDIASMAPDVLRLAPIRVDEAIVVSAIELQVESGPTGNQDARVVITAADTDWQPSGDAIYEGTTTIPDSFIGAVDITGLSVALAPGLYLLGLELDGGENALVMGRPAMFPGGVFCDDSTPGEVLNGLTAPHVYAPFAGPVPQWDTALHHSDTGPGSVRNYWLVPFVMKWDPA